VSLGTAGFASASDAYERGRPGYPDAFVSALRARWHLGRDSRVVDVAAGTGKLTRQLAAAGARCVAVEPSASMREECRRVSPGTDVVAGSAEALPFAAGSFDLASVAQAFHWFAPRLALHELARVLRPGGALALVWNERDTSLPWTQDLTAIMRRAGDPPSAPADQLRVRFEGDPHFGPFVRTSWPHEVPMAASDVEDMVASRSYVRVLPDNQRAEVLGEVRALLARLPDVLVMPYVTFAYCAEAHLGPCACACAGAETETETRGAPWSD
jgi:SAM-dependent methyltransferase